MPSQELSNFQEVQRRLMSRQEEILTTVKNGLPLPDDFVQDITEYQSFLRKEKQEKKKIKEEEKIDFAEIHKAKTKEKDYYGVLDNLILWTGSYLKSGSDSLNFGVVKNLFGAVNELQEETVSAWDFDRSKKFMELLCSVFNRIEYSSADHTSLRSIVNLAVMTGTEDILIYSDYAPAALRGDGRELFFALFIRLATEGKPEKAYKLLTSSSWYENPKMPEKLLHRMAKMSENEFLSWAQEPSSVLLLRLFLPDGNWPAKEQFGRFVMEQWLSDNADTGIKALKELSEVQDNNDSLLWYSIFVLCKKNYSEHIEDIYHSLSMMYCHYPNKKATAILIGRHQKFLLTQQILCRIVMEEKNIAVPEEDSDFSVFLQRAESLQNHSGSYNDAENDMGKNNDIYNDTKALLTSPDLNQKEKTLILDGMMGCVTGNWIPLFKDAWDEKNSLTLINAFEYTRGWYNSWPSGLLRCILLFIKETGTDRGSEILSWMERNSGIGNGIQWMLRNNINLAKNVLDHCCLENVSVEMLSLPWEEMVVCADRGEQDPYTCYRWMISHTDITSLDDTLYVFRLISADTHRGRTVYSDADRFFRSSNDEYAVCFYRLLARSVLPRYEGINIENPKSQIKLYPYKLNNNNENDENLDELYCCRFFISSLFTGDVKKAEDQHASSVKDIYRCFNLCFTLLNAGRKEEIPRLANMLPSDASKICQLVLELTDNDKEDSEKEKIYKSQKGNVQIAAAYLLSQKNDSNGSFIFCHSDEFGHNAETDFENLKENYGECILLPVVSKDETGNLGKAVKTRSSFIYTADTGEDFRKNVPRNSVPVPSFISQQCKGKDKEAKKISVLLQVSADYLKENKSSSDYNENLFDLAVYLCSRRINVWGDNEKFIASSFSESLRSLFQAENVKCFFMEYAKHEVGYRCMVYFAGNYDHTSSFIFEIFRAVNVLFKKLKDSADSGKWKADMYRSAYEEALSSLRNVYVPPKEVGWRNAKDSFIHLIDEEHDKLMEVPNLSGVRIKIVQDKMSNSLKP